jgi:F-type H+-transporting ATPase subunit a
VLFSNWLNLIPHFRPPTRDVNTTLGLALLVLVVAHINGIRTKGWKNYFKSYFQPYWFMFPSNLFSEFGKTVSHAFRLYGNIFAGGIIIGVVPEILVKLFHWFGVPIGVVFMIIADLFFGLFIGAIQALVFAMLAVAYITIQAS